MDRSPHDSAPKGASDSTRRASPAHQRLKLFLQFLNERSLIGKGDLPAIVRFFNQLDRRLGHLCALKGYLALRDVLFIIAKQADQGSLFGKVAVENNLLRQEQLQEVISLQRNPFDLFLESLKVLRVVDEEKLTQLLSEFDGAIRSPEEKSRLSSQDSPQLEIPMTDQSFQLSRDDVRETLRKITSLGTLPASVQRVLTLSADPDTKLADLAETIKADPSLSAEVLRLANSASEGAVRKITNISEAVNRLGMTAIRNLALATIVLNGLKGGDKKEATGIWMHSVATAIWAETLATDRPGVSSEDAFLAGLLHDIGRATILTNLPRAHAEIRKLTADGRPLKEAEIRTLSQTHADIGGYLCSLWQFPHEVVQAIAYHHAAPKILLIERARLLHLTATVNAACALGALPFDPEERSRDAELFATLDEEFVEFHRLKLEIVERVPDVQQRIKRYADWLA